MSMVYLGRLVLASLWLLIVDNDVVVVVFVIFDVAAAATAAAPKTAAAVAAALVLVMVGFILCRQNLSIVIRIMMNLHRHCRDNYFH